MAKKKPPSGYAISGKTSDRIRKGEIAADPLAARSESDDRPKWWAVRFGSGRGLGAGGSRRRDGGGTGDDGGRRVR